MHAIVNPRLLEPCSCVGVGLGRGSTWFLVGMDVFSDTVLSCLDWCVSTLTWWLCTCVVCAPVQGGVSESSIVFSQTAGEAGGPALVFRWGLGVTCL